MAKRHGNPHGKKISPFGYNMAWNPASKTRRKKLLKSVAEQHASPNMNIDHFADKNWHELPSHMKRSLSIEYMFGSGQSDVGNYDPLYDKRMKKRKKKNG